MNGGVNIAHFALLGYVPYYKDAGMKSFESNIRAKLETVSENSVDSLLGEFPSQLQPRLEREVESMDEQTAEEYLINKLIERKEALIAWKSDELPAAVEVVHEYPLAFIKSIEQSNSGGDKFLLGEGRNGRVLESIRNPGSCYKILFLERAKELHSSIVRESVMQYEVGTLLEGRDDVARVPKVLRFVDMSDLRAIMMEKIDGESIFKLMEDNRPLPENFDSDRFFEKLLNTIHIMNEKGYHHRDLTNNAGNVIIDKGGNPWLVDFGSTVKGFVTDTDPNHYQLTVNGPIIVGHDATGILGLKARVEEYLANRKKHHDRTD